jgi:hypothetical protein
MLGQRAETQMRVQHSLESNAGPTGEQRRKTLPRSQQLPHKIIHGWLRRSMPLTLLLMQFATMLSATVPSATNSCHLRSGLNANADHLRAHIDYRPV